MSDVEHILHPNGRVEVRKRPGASHAIDVREYISPFQLKAESFSHERKKYVNELFEDPGKWDSYMYESSRRVGEQKDLTDQHYQWTHWRDEYAKGDDEAMARMLSYVTDTNPPDKSPEMIASLLAKPRRGIFGRGVRAG